jgi:GH24 family phage-related lysozyme (muramidase)
MSPKDPVKDKSYPFLTAAGIELIKRYSTPRTLVGPGRYMSYKEYGEDIWRIGYGSKKIGRRLLNYNEVITEAQIEKQLVEDLKEFSKKVSQYVHVPLNKNRRGAVLSFAHSLGICSFKTCRLLNLINSYAKKQEIIREWSPYINRIWLSGGDTVVARRRSELDLYFTADKEIPTFYEHNCELKNCLLNIPETYNGSPSQVKAIEYLEEKIIEWDPSGKALQHFFRLWVQRPGGLASYRDHSSDYKRYLALQKFEVEEYNFE